MTRCYVLLSGIVQFWYYLTETNRLIYPQSRLKQRNTNYLQRQQSLQILMTSFYILFTPSLSLGPEYDGRTDSVDHAMKRRKSCVTQNTATAYYDRYMYWFSTPAFTAEVSHSSA